MENNEISKSNKIKIIVITLLVFIVSVAGISYAYFTIRVTGNEEASSMRLTTANMQLIYTDVQIVSGEYTQPGWTQTKTLTVQNTGNQTVEYAIIWRDLYNEITNGELVISATCTSNVQGNTCNGIDEKIVPTKLTEAHNILVKSGISIEPNETHTYTLTALFKETGSNQNYNQNKEFYGTLNIADGSQLITDTMFFEYEKTATSVTYDIDLNTCKNYIMTEWEYSESDATSYCTNDIEDDLLGFYISSSEYSDYGLSNVVYEGGVSITGYKSEVPVSVTYDINMTTCINHIISNSGCNGDTTCEQNAEARCDKDSGSPMTIEYALLNSYISSSEYSDYGLSNVNIITETAPTDVIIPSTIEGFPVTTIGDNAFASKDLTSVVIPSSVTAIGRRAFSNNQLTSVTLNEGLIEIGGGGHGAGAFSNNQLTSVVIPDSVTTIGLYAFENNQLTSVAIPSSVTTIAIYAFYQNQLTSVIIEGKSSSSDFTTYGTNIWGWANDVTCVTNNTSNVTNGCITWTGSGS